MHLVALETTNPADVSVLSAILISANVLVCRLEMLVVWLPGLASVVAMVRCETCGPRFCREGNNAGLYAPSSGSDQFCVQKGRISHELYLSR